VLGGAHGLKRMPPRLLIAMLVKKAHLGYARQDRARHA